MTSKEQEEQEEKNDEKKKKLHGKDTVSSPKALEVVRPNTNISSDISSEARELMSSFVNFVEELAMEATPSGLPPPQETAGLVQDAAGLTGSNKRARISTHDIDVTNSLILPSGLAKHAVFDGSKTVSNDDEATPTDIPRDETTVFDSPSTFHAPPVPSIPPPRVPVSSIPPPRMTVSIIPPPRVPVSSIPPPRVPVTIIPPSRVPVTIIPPPRVPVSNIPPHRVLVTIIPPPRVPVSNIPPHRVPVTIIPPPRVLVSNIPPPRVLVSDPSSSEGSNSDPRRPPLPRVPDLNRSPPASISDSSSDEATGPNSASSWL